VMSSISAELYAARCCYAGMHAKEPIIAEIHINGWEFLDRVDVYSEAKCVTL